MHRGERRPGLVAAAFLPEEPREAAPEDTVVEVGDRLEERERYVLATTDDAWSKRLSSGASRSMRAARRSLGV